MTSISHTEHPISGLRVDPLSLQGAGRKKGANVERALYMYYLITYSRNMR